MTKKKSSGTTTVHVDDHRYCDVCLKSIHVGTGGDANWNMHVGSKEHRQYLLNTKTPKLTTFFQPTSRIDSVSAVNNDHRPNPLFKPDSENLPVGSSVHNSSSQSHPRSPFPPITTTNLRQLVDALQMEIPIGAISDPLGKVLCTDIATEIMSKGGREPYEIIDIVLNKYVGFSRPNKNLTAIVTKGSFGLLRFCDWLDAMISQYDIEPDLLNPWLNKLCNVVRLCQGKYSASSENVPLATCSKQPEVDYIRVRCPGLTLTTQPGQSPFTAYPLLRHTVQSLPWEEATEAVPCPLCAALATRHDLASVQQAILQGCPENTPLAYLPTYQLLETLRRKTDECNALKLSALNTARTLSRRHRSGGANVATHPSEDVPQLSDSSLSVVDSSSKELCRHCKIPGTGVVSQCHCCSEWFHIACVPGIESPDGEWCCGSACQDIGDGSKKRRKVV